MAAQWVSFAEMRQAWITAGMGVTQEEAAGLVSANLLPRWDRDANELLLRGYRAGHAEALDMAQRAVERECSDPSASIAIGRMR